METLSRREEDALMKTAKARALKECDTVVKGVSAPFLELTTSSAICTPEFADCAAGRTITVAWACKDKYAAVQSCMLQ